MKIWKKNAVLATVILFVCVAVYLNWSYGRGEAAAGEDTAETEAGDNADIGDAALVDDTAGGEETPVSLENEGEENVTETADETDYFNTARLTRQQARDNSLSLLRESTDNETLSQEKRDEAAEAINTIADYAIAEAQIESLVIAKGFKDCVAFINEDGIDVVVAAMGTGLQAEDVSRIKDIVVGETDIEVENIKIIEVTE